MSPKKTQGPRIASMKEISKDQQAPIDLNDDGILDVPPSPQRNESFEHRNQADKFFMDLGGLKTANSGLIRFLVAPPEVRRLCDSNSVVVCTDTNARFYVFNSALSFAPGQNVMAVNDDGRHDEVFVLTGIALEFPLGPVNLKVHPTVVHDPHHFGYGTFKGNIIEVSLDHLRWVVGKNEVVDPDRLQSGAAPQNIAESMLKPLFQEVAKLPNQFPGDKQKTTRLKQFNTLVDTWKKSVAIIDVDRTTGIDRATELQKEPLWAGIHMALAKLAGLTPADFPG